MILAQNRPADGRDSEARVRAPSSAGPLILAGAGLISLLVGLLDTINFTVDDSFISLRYAENFARGRGLVFNAGERVEGYSNFLWTLLLSGLARLGVNQGRSDLALLIAAKAMGSFFAVATFALTAWFVHRIARPREWGEHTWLLWAALLGFGTAYSFSTWSMSGMETALCTFLVTGAVACTFLGLRAGRENGVPDLRFLMAGAVLFAIASLTRPEPIVVWAFAAVTTILLAAPSARRSIALAMVPPFLIHGTFVLWRHAYYGTWIPNSVAAKAGGGAMAAVLGAKYTLLALYGSIGVLGLAFLATGPLLRRGLEWKFLALFCIGYIGFVAVSGGDWMPGYRFLVPALPALWILGAAALAEMTRALGSRPWSVAALVLILAPAAFAGDRFLVRSQLEFPTGLKELTWVGSPERVAIAKDIGRIVSREKELAVGECGFVPYFNPDLRIIDLFGLMNPRIARMPGVHFSKMTATYFLAIRPAYYLMMVKRASQGAGGITVPSHPDGVTLLASSAFRERYEAIRSYSGFVLYRRRS